MTLQYFLLLLAFLSFVLAAFKVDHRWVSFGWLGLAFWAFSLLTPLLR